MQPSRIGSGYVSSNPAVDMNSRRTSASLLLDGMVSASHPQFSVPMKAVQAAAWHLTGGSALHVPASPDSSAHVVMSGSVFGPQGHLYQWWEVMPGFTLLHASNGASDQIQRCCWLRVQSFFASLLARCSPGLFLCICHATPLEAEAF